MSDSQKISMPNADKTHKAAARSENPNPRVSGTATVTVALKYPTGLIIRGQEFVELSESAPMGYRTVKKAVDKVDPATGEPIQAILNGTRGHRGSTRIEIVGGFALTHGVSEELWDHWLHHNEHSALVRNGLIFAGGNPEAVRAEARNRSGERTNMEPLRPLTGKPGEKLNDARLDKKISQFDRESEEAV